MIDGTKREMGASDMPDVTQEQWEQSEDPEWMLATALELDVSLDRVMRPIAELTNRPSADHAHLQATSDKIWRCLKDPLAPWDALTDFEHDLKRMCDDASVDRRVVHRMVEEIVADWMALGHSRDEALEAVSNALGMAISWDSLKQAVHAVASPIPTPPEEAIKTLKAKAEEMRRAQIEAHAALERPPPGAILGKTCYAEVLADMTAYIRKIPKDWKASAEKWVWCHGYPTQEIAEAYARAKLREMGELPENSEMETIHGKGCVATFQRADDTEEPWLVQSFGSNGVLIRSHWCTSEIGALDHACKEIKRLDAEPEADESKQVHTGVDTSQKYNIEFAVSPTMFGSDAAIRDAVVEAIERAQERGKKKEEKMTDTLEPVDTGSVEYARLCLRAQSVAVECTSMDARRALCREMLSLCLEARSLGSKAEDIKRDIRKIERGEHARDKAMSDSATERAKNLAEIVHEILRLGIRESAIRNALDRVERARPEHVFTQLVADTAHLITPGQYTIVPHDEEYESVSGTISVDKTGQMYFHPDPQETTTMSKDPAPAPTPSAPPTKIDHALKTLQSDATDAAWRTAGSQFVKLAREPLVAALCRHLAPGDDSIRGKIAAFLETEIGTAMLASLLSIGLSSMPARAGEVPQKLARELRVAAMADTADLVADLLIGPMRTVVSLYLEDPAHTLRVETPALEGASNVVGIGEAREKVGAGT